MESTISKSTYMIRPNSTMSAQFRIVSGEQWSALVEIFQLFHTSIRAYPIEAGDGRIPRGQCFHSTPNRHVSVQGQGLVGSPREGHQVSYTDQPQCIDMESPLLRGQSKPVEQKGLFLSALVTPIHDDKEERRIPEAGGEEFQITFLGMFLYSHKSIPRGLCMVRLLLLRLLRVSHFVYVRAVEGRFGDTVGDDIREHEGPNGQSGT